MSLNSSLLLPLRRHVIAISTLLIRGGLQVERALERTAFTFNKVVGRAFLLTATIKPG